MIAVIDYGMGNIHSIQKALGLLGAKTIVTNRPADLKKCTKVVLPGVGAFGDAMSELKKRNLATALKEFISGERILLGICLGMQLLFEKSEEAAKTKINGLCILQGRVKKFKNKVKFKVPHMGWNQLKIKKKGCPLLKGIQENAYVYFCHSYYPYPYDKRVIAASTNYSADFASVVWKDNIYGVQFHPEKSQETGLKILKNFVAIR